MDERARLTKAVEDAERELDAATKPSEIRAAARKRRLALEGLHWFDQQETAKPKRPTSRARRPASS